MIKYLKNFWSRQRKAYQGTITIIILFSMNMINNADRYIISSVLIDIEKFFDVSKSIAGLLQTIYLLFFMLSSPFNGYLGDRINRKYMLITGLLLWLVSIIVGSLFNQNQFIYFVITRCFFGIATGIYQPVAIPIIGDRFAHDEKMRSRALVLFNMGPPLGIGLSYIIGVLSKELVSDDWRYSMRFTPFFLIFILILILIGYVEPPKANSKIENEEEQTLLDKNAASAVLKKRKYIQDVKILFKNRTYVLLVLAWACGLTSYGM